MWLWPSITLVGADGSCPKGILVEVSWAVIRCVQGLTLPGVSRLQDTDSPLFALCKLYVGISQATAAENVEVS